MNDYILLAPLYIMVGLYLLEKGIGLYGRVMADGKVTLDEVEEIVEEVVDAVETVKEMVSDDE